MQIRSVRAIQLAVKVYQSSKVSHTFRHGHLQPGLIFGKVQVMSRGRAMTEFYPGSGTCTLVAILLTTAANSSVIIACYVNYCVWE